MCNLCEGRKPVWSSDRMLLNGPTIYLTRNPSSVITEATISDIVNMIDPKFLDHARRAEEIPNDANLTHIDLDGTMHFIVPSGTSRLKIYKCLVRFVQWQDIGSDPNLGWEDKANVLINDGDVQLHCTCPSFLWWGFEWILTQYNAAIKPVDIPPDKRNPERRGAICKHLNRTLREVPKYRKKIVEALKRDFG